MPTGRAGVTDYSKWDRLDDSDDEKHSHPNIDIGLQRRIQRELRGRKEGEDDQKKSKLTAAIEKDSERLKVIEDAIAKNEGDVEGLKKEKEALTKAISDRKAKIKKIDESQQLYVNGTTGETNMYKEVFNHGGVNTGGGEHKDGFMLPPKNEKDEQFEQGMDVDKDGYDFIEFGNKHEELLEEYLKLGSEQMDETRDFLVEHANIILQEHALAWTKLKALQLEMDDRRAEMKHACRQSEVLYAIAELSKAHRRHPGNLIVPFCEGLKQPQRFSAFVEGADHFAKQIMDRAKAKKREQELGLQPGQDPYEAGTIVEAHSLKGLPELNGKRGRTVGKQGERIGVLFPEPYGKKALKKDNLKIIQCAGAQQAAAQEETQMVPMTEEERRAACTDPDKLWWLPYDAPVEDRMGPGGLDPCEVFKQLPRSIQDAFRSREIKPLQDAIAAMEEEDARKWLEMCTKAGLWNPGGGDDDDGGDEGGEGG